MWRQIECGDTYENCNENEGGDARCTNVRSSKCPPLKPDFECMDEGVFPDPLNCKRFFNCYVDGSGDLGADQYECDYLYVFDPSDPTRKQNYCRFTRNARLCISAACTGTTKNILMNFPFFPANRGQFVATCRSKGKSPLVTMCKAGFIADLQSLPVQCQLTCRAAAKAEYDGDNNKYWQCVFNGRTWEAKVKSCFRGDIFNAKTKACIRDPSRKF